MTREVSPQDSDNQVPALKERTGLIAYFKDSWGELKKVVWPKRPDAVRMTFFVIVFVAVFAVFSYAVDTVIAWLLNIVLVKG